MHDFGTYKSNSTPICGRPEAASDVKSGEAVGEVGYDVHVYGVDG